MEHSLPTPITFNIDVTDLYSEWKHWSSAFEIYVIASDLNKKEDAVQSHNAALPWRHSAKHFQHAPWRTQEPWRGQDHLEWVRYAKTERGSRTLQTQVENREGRWVVQWVPDEPLRAGKILRLWHFGKDDKRPNRREVLFPNLKEKSASARRPWLCKTVKIARNAETAIEEAPLLSQGTRESPTQIDHVHPSQGSQVKPFSCYRCGGTDGNVAQSSPGLISEKSWTLAEGLLLKIESWPKGQERKRKDTTYEGLQLEFETWYWLAWNQLRWREWRTCILPQWWPFHHRED